ncbi:MAG: hypothetical protein AABX07_03850 [Nanoarchaeota archaeon]
MRGETLYIGFDEAGHASDNILKGEVVVAFYSLDANDASPLPFRRNRKSRDAQAHLIMAQNNYFFTTIPADKSKQREANLVLVAPLLLDKCISEVQLTGARISQFGVYFDGANYDFCAEALYEDMSANFPSMPCIAIQHFKKNNNRRNLRLNAFVKCPRVVYCADQRAHVLYSASHELEGYDKYIPLPEGYIERRIFELEKIARGAFTQSNPQSSKERLFYRKPFPSH